MIGFFKIKISRCFWYASERAENGGFLCMKRPKTGRSTAGLSDAGVGNPARSEWERRLGFLWVKGLAGVAESVGEGGALEECVQVGLLCRKSLGAAGEFEEPSHVSLWQNSSVNGFIWAGEQDGFAGEAADDNWLERGGQFSGGNRGKLDLVAPAIDVGEVAADIPREDSDAPVGSGTVRAGNGPGAFSHRLVSVGLPVGGYRAGGKLRGGGGGNLRQTAAGHGRGGIGGHRCRGDFWGGWGGGGFFLRDGVGDDLGFVVAAEEEKGRGEAKEKEERT